VFEETVRSFLECHTDGIDHELVLVDNNSTDGTREIAERFATMNSRIRHVMEPQEGLSHARNNGIRMAVGDIVAFVDDDVIFSPFWLTAIDSAFKRRPDIACIGGKVVPHFETDRPSWIEDDILWIYGVTRYGDLEREIFPPEVPIGCNMAFRRSVFEQIGVFHTSLGRTPASLLSGEDDHILHRVADAGLKTLYSPEARVAHRISPVRLTPQWVLSRYYWGGVSVVALKQVSDDPLPRMMLARRAVRKILSMVRRWREATGVLGTRFGKGGDIPMKKQVDLCYSLGELRQTVAETFAFHGEKGGESGRPTEAKRH
jgi:glycosyltransferase involved in cell wall biosynthesis